VFLRIDRVTLEVGRDVVEAQLDVLSRGGEDRREVQHARGGVVVVFGDEDVRVEAAAVVRGTIAAERRGAACDDQHGEAPHAEGGSSRMRDLGRGRHWTAVPRAEHRKHVRSKSQRPRACPALRRPRARSTAPTTKDDDRRWGRFRRARTFSPISRRNVQAEPNLATAGTLTAGDGTAVFACTQGRRARTNKRGDPFVRPRASWGSSTSRGAPSNVVAAKLPCGAGPAVNRRRAREFAS